jgi:hypothetical protein
MDAKGAKILTERIAERQWQLAESVQRGEQPATDPDAARLEAIGDDYRLYRFPANRDGGDLQVRKVLVDGFWCVEDVEAHTAA